MGCSQSGEALMPIRSGDSPMGFLRGKSRVSVFEGIGIVGAVCHFSSAARVRNHVE